MSQQGCQASKSASSKADLELTAVPGTAFSLQTAVNLHGRKVLDDVEAMITQQLFPKLQACLHAGFHLEAVCVLFLQEGGFDLAPRTLQVVHALDQHLHLAPLLHPCLLLLLHRLLHGATEEQD